MSLKGFLIGSPLSTHMDRKERFSKTVGLAILSSDALSSVAYATEQILGALLLTKMALISYSMHISVAIAILIAIVAASYIQSLHVFPKGGGAYVIAKHYLGRKASLIGGASLIIDYIMTVTVSITAGVAAITSAFPIFYHYRVALCFLCLIILMIANLRGIKESGRLFCLPVYLFIVLLFVMIGIGIAERPHIPEYPPVNTLGQPHLLIAWMLLRSFSSGCVALTGIEAVASGVQNFKTPEAKNARITLLWMAILLIILFLGITHLAWKNDIIPTTYETVLSQISRNTFGIGIVYYLLQIATCLILILAANTAYAGFPRLCSIMAADNFLPKQLTNRGDRLVFSNGILLLTFFAALLIFLFEGNTNALIPLYTVGVFSAFTLSQIGMVRHWLLNKGKGWMRGILINGVGAIVTFIVLLIVAVTKFIHGSWMVLVATPLLVYMMLRIYRHYAKTTELMKPTSKVALPHYDTLSSMILVSSANKCALNAVNYAKSLHQSVEAIYISINPLIEKNVETEWLKYCSDTPLIILPSPHRSLIEPLTAYIDQWLKENPTKILNLILPALIPQKWYHQLLHNQTMLVIRMLMLFKPRVITITVPTLLA